MQWEYSSLNSYSASIAIGRDTAISVLSYSTTKHPNTVILFMYFTNFHVESNNDDLKNIETYAMDLSVLFE